MSMNKFNHIKIYEIMGINIHEINLLVILDLNLFRGPGRALVVLLKFHTLTQFFSRDFRAGWAVCM